MNWSKAKEVSSNLSQWCQSKCEPWEAFPSLSLATGRLVRGVKRYLLAHTDGACIRGREDCGEISLFKFAYRNGEEFYNNFR